MKFFGTWFGVVIAIGALGQILRHQDNANGLLAGFVTTVSSTYKGLSGQGG